MLKMDAKGKTYKQMTIGAWKGFKKTIKHNNKEVEVKVQQTAVIEEKNILWLHCLKRFKTNSNLAVHLKCKHPENRDPPLSKPYISLTTNDRTKAVVRSVFVNSRTCHY